MTFPSKFPAWLSVLSGLSGLVLVLVLGGCVDSFAPDVLAEPRNYLVVDGFINTSGSTTIKLSRTFAISTKPKPTAETKASVFIEEEGGGRFALAERPLGTYTSAALQLSPEKQYRLYLRTSAGQEYASDFVPAKRTPEIDEVRWRAEKQNLVIYLRTHDDTNTTQYYRWDYSETWEINPVYNPAIEYAKGEIRDIEVPFPSVCWGSEPSTTIQVDKTTSLSQDVIADYRLRVMPQNSERLYSRYSILVQQHALTKEEYGYWELLRKNTENLGTLFDPQPVQLTGNVHNLTAPDQLAVGFIGAHSLTEKRIFIERKEIPREWRVLSGYESCIPPDSVFFFRGPPPFAPISETLFAAFNPSTGYLPVAPIIDGGLIGYTAQKRDCIDCRTRGTAVRPSFW